jgi:hypothetical protein
MTTLATDQVGDVKTGLKAGITKLEAAGKLVEDKAVAAKDGLKHATAAMLDSAQNATNAAFGANCDNDYLYPYYDEPTYA